MGEEVVQPLADIDLCQFAASHNHKKATHGGKGAIVAIVKGTRVEDAVKALMRILWYVYYGIIAENVFSS